MSLYQLFKNAKNLPEKGDDSSVLFFFFIFFFLFSFFSFYACFYA